LSPSARMGVDLGHRRRSERKDLLPSFANFRVANWNRTKRKGEGTKQKRSNAKSIDSITYLVKGRGGGIEGSRI